MAFCFAALCNAALRVLPQRFSSCHMGFFVPRHWHVLCRGIGDCVARLATALATAFHRVGYCVLRCATAFTLSGVLQHPGLFRMFLFFSRKWRKRCPILDVPFFTHQDATFRSTLSGCSFILFFDTSRCHFPEHRNTHNFPEVPFASPESRAADAPFLEALYFFITLRCHFPKRRNFFRKFPFLL